VTRKKQGKPHATNRLFTLNATMTSLEPQFTPKELEKINQDLQEKTPQEILTWAIDNVKGLYQTTAFGL
jgi:hypothetical protein